MAWGKVTVFLLLCYTTFCTAATETDTECNVSLQGSAIPQERKLMNCLTEGYDPAIRPVAKPSDVINLTVDMVLLQIVDLHEKSQMIEVNAWLQMQWEDSQLKWDGADYNGVTTMKIPTNRIWTPDIDLLNSAEDQATFVRDKLAIVHSTGFVIWIPHMRFRSFCKFDLTHFPFDTQKCKLLIGSWSYSSSELSFTKPNNYSRKFVWDTHEWDVKEYTVEKKSFFFTEGKNGRDHYPYLLYTLTLERQGIFYGTILVAPAVLMAVLIICTFLIPPDAKERITLGVGILICLTLFVSVLDDYLPSEMQSMPAIFQYVLFDFIMATLSLMASVLVLNCYHRGVRKDRVPNWLRTLTLGMMRKLCCLRMGGYNTLPAEVTSTEASGTPLRFGSTASDQEFDTPLPKSPTMALERVLDEIRRYLKQLSGNQNPPSEMPSHQQLLMEEWHMVALVVDRILFWLFLVVTVIVTIAIMSH